MASPQTDKGFIRVANELYEEILRRDFTKRQQNMLLFIMRLSYGCGRKECEIPKFNYFEIIGLYKGDIKKELKYLRSCKVIEWSEDNMTFSINKNYDVWQLSPSKNYDKERLNELISLNLKGKKVSKTLTEDTEQEVSKTLTSEGVNQDAIVSEILTKIEGLVSETLTKKLVKHELEQASNPCESKAAQPSKDIIKDIIKDNKNNSSIDIEANETLFNEFWDLYNKKTGKAKSKKKFLAVIKKTPAEEIMDGVKRYNAKLEREGTNKKYKKDPLTFLNGEHWTDEYIQEEQQTPKPQKRTGKAAVNKKVDHNKVLEMLNDEED